MNNGLLIWPADNSALRYTGFDWPDVLVVSGATREDTMAAFSSYGPAIDLCAPAVSIFTSQRGGTYTWQAGNSFAGPLVAGTAAMIWSMDPWLNSWQVERALITSTDDLGPPGRDECFGHGRLNLAQAIRLGSRTDFNRDGSIDFFDYDDFLIGFDRGDRRADINLDGTVDFFDYDWFIGLFMGL
jgi:subtilisin family serine protease